MNDHLDAYSAYQRHLAICLHFSSPSYDATKYNFKTRGKSPEAFKNSPQAYWFDRLSKKYNTEDLTNAFVAQCIAGKKWGGLHESGQAFEKTYLDWKKRSDALTETFKTDLLALQAFGLCSITSLRDLFVIVNGTPLIIACYAQKKIQLETVCIVDTLTGFIVKSESTVTNTLQWPDITRLIRKYQSFLSFDKEKFKAILLEQFPV